MGIDIDDMGIEEKLNTDRMMMKSGEYGKKTTQEYFDDSIEKFVQVLKQSTSAVEINIFNTELIQIYKDIQAQKLSHLKGREGLEEKLIDF